jgi:hypothetical protein
MRIEATYRLLGQQKLDAGLVAALFDPFSPRFHHDLRHYLFAARLMLVLAFRF